MPETKADKKKKAQSRDTREQFALFDMQVTSICVFRIFKPSYPKR